MRAVLKQCEKGREIVEEGCRGEGENLDCDVAAGRKRRERADLVRLK